MGMGRKTVGAVCDPTAFSGLVEVPAGVLGPKHGCVVVDLVEPGKTPIEWPGKVVREDVFKDDVPGIVIRIVDTADGA
jgi:hypothetical protein